MQSRLDELNAISAQLDQEIAKEESEMENARTDYEEAAKSIVELAKKTFSPENSLPHLYNNHEDLKKFMNTDALLTEEFDRELAEWRQRILEIYEPDITEGERLDQAQLTEKQRMTLEIDKLVTMYICTERKYIQAESAHKGFEAKVQTMEKESRKVNGLPQILPILQSSKEAAEKEAREAIEKRKQIEKDVIEPALSSLAKLSIQMPLMEDEIRRNYEILVQLDYDLDRLQESVIRQRAYLQFLLYSMEIDRTRQRHGTHILKALVEDLQQEKPPSLQQNEENDGACNDDQTILWIETLLNIAADSATALSSEAASVHDNVQSIMETEGHAKKLWSKKFSSSLDHLRQLRISPMPAEVSEDEKSYLELQIQLQGKNEELKHVVEELERITIPDPALELKKELFSLFYLDQHQFKERIQVQNDPL
ncbi:hypothetical protein EC973_005613 [Apophysomyces ossiformis]|uniref:Uncharacterized protein n=1 Tax=Apophysomyces ossiformis TaxID=679940 RepID=A0A8H7BWC3_9FUNG|nr:hypothetical protein EC973_005613 [Apophysomyces ossiformis]